VAEQVIIEFVGDTSKLEPAIDILAKAGQVSEKDAAAFKKLNTEGSKAMAGVNAGSKTAIKSLGDVEKSAKKLATTFEDEVAAGIKDALDDAGVTVDEFTDALNKAGGSVSDLVEEAKQLSATAVPLKKQLKDINNELQLMAEQGLQNTKRYQELREKAGELKDTISDVSEEVARAGSDTRGLDNILQIASGLTATFAVAQGSMALFGEEGEEVQKTLLKVNAAMAVLQGLQQLQAIASQKNFQSLTALIGIEKIQTLQTTLQTAAESKNIIVRNLAIISQKALNAVLAANPIFLIVAAIALIATAWAVFTANTKKAAEAQNLLNNALLEGDKLLEASLSGIEDAEKKQLAAARLRGATTNELVKIEGQAGNARLQAIKDAQVATDRALNDQRVKRRLDAEEYQKLIDQKSKLDIDYNNALTDLQVKASDFQRKQYEDSLKSYQAFVDAKVTSAQKGSIAELEAQITAVKTAAETTKKLSPDLTKGELQKLASETQRQVLELQNQIQIKTLENEKFLMEAKLATIKEGSIAELEEQKKIAEQTSKIELAQLGISDQRKKQLIAENAKEQLDFDRQIRERELQGDLDTINARAAASKQGSVDEFSARLDALRVQNEIDLNAKGVTDEKKLLLEKDYNKNVLALTREFNAQVQTETINTKQAEINQKLADLQKLSTSETNADLLQLKKDAVEQQAQLDIVSAHQSINNEELLAQKILEIRKKANADKLAIDQQAAVAEINFRTDINNIIIENEKKRVQRQAEGVGLNFRAQRDALNKLQQLNIEQINGEINALEEKHRRGLISEEDYQKELLRLQGDRIDSENAAEAAAADTRKKIIGAALQIIGEGVTTYFDIQAQQRQDDLDSALKALDTRKQAELDNKNLTEAQKANIDARYQQKQAQLQRKAFEADKQAKKQQAIIAGALAVVQAFAQLGPIGGAIAAIVIAATTAFQVAKITSAQAPAFKKGTRNAPKGYKWVGEEGPELIWSKGGEVIYPYKQSMQVADAWRGGSLAHADDIIRGNIASPNEAVLSGISVNASGQFSFDYDAMAEAMYEHIPAPNIVQNNIDANGLTSFVLSNGNRMQQLNKRYQINP
jgi:hypothetical protein